MVQVQSTVCHLCLTVCYFLIYWFRFSELASNSCLAFAIFHLLQLNSLHCSGNDVGENPACRFRMENGEIGTFQVNITMSQITML